MLKGSKSLYPEGKNISLKGIFGNINEVRKESINILKDIERNYLLKN